MSKLNEQQQAVVDSDSDKILVLAGAGAGKTFTMLARIGRLIEENVSPTSILVLTFTNKAAFDMRDRYRKAHADTSIPEFRTFHSFCYHLIVTDRSIREAIGYQSVPSIPDAATLRHLETQAKMQSGVNLSPDKLSGKDTSLSMKEKQDLKIYQKTYLRLLKTRNLITFDLLSKEVTDLFSSGSPLTAEYKTRYKYIFVDEFQDTDAQQVRFIQSFKRTNFCLVGDAIQCQPGESLVTMHDDSLKPIRDIVSGDRVKAYKPRDGRYASKRVNAIAHHLGENIVEVKSANHASKYTKEHITYAKMHLEGNEDCRCVYLMCNSSKNWWRIGECSLFLNHGVDFGPRHRLVEEHADKVWILDICSNNREASWYVEQMAAFKYGIPDTTWQFNNVHRYTAETMNELYNNIPDIRDRAIRCLSAFGRDINYPFYNKATDERKHMSKLHMFETYVGNLIPRLMDVVTPCEKLDSKYTKLHNKYEQILEIVPCDPEEVYSLDIEDFHNYISDGILTHNCIYQFRGCSNEVIKMLSRDDSWEHIRLFENYRSTTEICEFANNMSTYAEKEYRIEMHGQRSGDPVVVIPGADSGWTSAVDEDHADILLDKLRNSSGHEDIAVLCRSNREVAYICDTLKSNGILYSSGKRNEDALNILKSVYDNEYMLDWLASFLTSDQYADFIRLAAQEENPDIYWFSKTYGSVQAIGDRGKVIVAIRNELKSKKHTVTKVGNILKVLGLKSGELLAIQTDEDIVPNLIDLIETQGDQDIYVGTIHSSKGLEYDTVYIMGVNDKSFRLGTEEVNNLYYVALTRAKNHLVVFSA